MVGALVLVLLLRTTEVGTPLLAKGVDVGSFVAGPDTIDVGSEAVKVELLAVLFDPATGVGGTGSAPEAIAELPATPLVGCDNTPLLWLSMGAVSLLEAICFCDVWLEAETAGRGGGLVGEEGLVVLSALRSTLALTVALLDDTGKGW